MTVTPLTRDEALRAHVRRGLNAHLTALGYTNPRPVNAGDTTPEIVRRNPVRGRIVYGEIVLHSDLKLPSCHKRLMSFSQRRTRRRSTILFFIGVVESELGEIETLLEKLGIRSAVGGGHVHVVPVPAPQNADPQKAAPPKVAAQKVAARKAAPRKATTRKAAPQKAAQ